MEPTPPTSPGPVPPPSPGRFRARQLLYWLPLAAVLGTLMAWAAAEAQRLFAPFLAFPLVVGVMLGLLLVALVRLCHVGHRPTIVIGAALACLLAVVGQHYAGYWKARQQAARTSQEVVARLAFPDLEPPPSFLEFLRREAEIGRPLGRGRLAGTLAWLTWSADALLVLVPAMVLVVVSARLPYCNECQRWYQTIRGGRISPSVAAEIARALGVALGGEARSARCRMVACHRGCGPTGLALSWDGGDRGHCSSGFVWLDPPQRNRLLEILDRPAAPDE